MKQIKQAIYKQKLPKIDCQPIAKTLTQKMKPNNQQPKNEYQEILKKIEAQSKEKKQQRQLNIMRGETSKNKSYTSTNYLGSVKAYFNGWRVDIGRYFRVKENRHTAIMTVFLLFSSYIAWNIQKKYDRLRKKAQRTQTFKQHQVQKENQYIQKMLKKKQFESVPIPTQLEESTNYKFEQTPSRGGLVIDTKQDLMDLISKDKGVSKTPQQVYEDEIRRTRENV